jgi:hypothetical protein
MSKISKFLESLWQKPKWILLGILYVIWMLFVITGLTLLNLAMMLACGITAGWLMRKSP